MDQRAGNAHAEVCAKAKGGEVTDKQVNEALKLLILKKGSKEMKKDLREIERIHGKIRRLTKKILKEQAEFVVPDLLGVGGPAQKPKN